MFSGFKLFIFARTFVGIRHREALKFVSSPTLLSKIPEFWYPIAEIVKLAGIWRHHRIPFYAIGIFSYEPSAGKYFQENHFFLKIDFVKNILQ
jgi:hypothetical protein